MPTVLLRPLFHRGQEVIAIESPKGREPDLAIRKLKGIRWTQTHKVWYLPLSRDNYQKITDAVKTFADVDSSPLKKYLERRKNVTATQAPVEKQLLGQRPLNRPVVATAVWKLSAANLAALNRFMEHLKLKAYSASTIKTYRNEFLQLLQLVKMRLVDELTPDDLRRYFVYCFEKLKLTENTLHSRINAVKFYFEQVLGKEKFFWEIPRPKKAMQLPRILNETELGNLFRAIENLKHKAIVFTAYSAGLRVSEVVGLKPEDIDSKRMTLFIANAKGKKDRWVNLSPLVLDILRSYVRKAEPRPAVYLFEGHLPGVAYSIRSAQQIFTDAKTKAGIYKGVSFHGLRHSFATHLLEKGVDIKYIKDILGHFDIGTTERYLHVAKNKLVNITSPLDDLREKGIL